MAIIVGLLALLAAGALYQQWGIMRHRRRFVPPGAFIDVAGHRVHAVCKGSGAPLVLLESGIAASSLSWSAVQPEIARFTRVCSYDRAGLGWSDVPCRPRTFQGIVLDLDSLLDHLADDDPCVLVGHSFGSFVIRGYAARHPHKVIGLVLVDPAAEWLTPNAHRAYLLRGGRQLAQVGAWLARVGVVRACLALLTGGAPGAPRTFVKVFGPTAARTLERLVGEVRKLPADVHPSVQAMWCQPKCFDAMADHLRTLERDIALIAAAVPPPDVPVIVISGKDRTADEIAAQRALADTSTAGRHITTARSGHWIHFDEPELIVSVVRELVEGWRARTP